MRYFEPLEPRLQFSGIQYGFDVSGDPAATGVLHDTGPGLKDLGAKGVRLFTNVSFLASDFAALPSGKIYLRKPELVTALGYAKKYHAAGIAVTLCIQLSLDRSMTDGSLLIDKATLAVAHVDPVSLGVLDAPGGYGCALAIGEGQGAGNFLSYGGPPIPLVRAQMLGGKPEAVLWHPPGPHGP